MGLFLEKEVKLDKVVFVLFTQHDLEPTKKRQKRPTISPNTL